MTTGNLGLMLQASARLHAERPAMRWASGTTWQSLTYAELGARVRMLAMTLVDAGVGVGDRVGIFSQNRPEWSVADFAILSVGAVSVPIYATSTAQQAGYIVRDAGIRIMFVGAQEQYDKLAASPAAEQLEAIVVFDEEVALSGASSVPYSEFLSRGPGAGTGEDVDARLSAVAPDDLATLVYTSGTTGDPKGAMLTHGNFLHQLAALDDRFTVDDTDVSLCFLPLSHAYERGWSFHVLHCGAENCYVQDPKAVAAALVAVRPTLMVSVPRLYEKIHAAVIDRAEHSSTVRRALFGWAVRTGLAAETRAAEGRPVGAVLRAEHAVADRLVLARIRDALGGPKKVLAAGGAPLSREIEEFFLAAGVLVCQGYGLTETASMLTCNAPGAFRFGTVGRPILGTQIAIAEDGEILARGGNVMAGYYGRPAETAAVLVDGWLKTGDVGYLDDDGYLTVTDRIKDLIITSQGKNVAPQHIEGIIGADPLIEQVVVIGDRRSYLTALVEPAFPALERYATEHGIAFASPADLVERPEVLALYEQRIAGRSAELAGYEKVKRFTLLSRELTQESGQLTPTMKIRRAIVEREFGDAIDAMYAAPRQPTG